MGIFWSLLSEGTGGDTVSGDWVGGLVLALQIIFGVLIGVSVLWAIWLGFHLMNASDESKRQQAKKRIFMAVSGLVIIAILFAIMTTINASFGTPGGGDPYKRPGNGYENGNGDDNGQQQDGVTQLRNPLSGNVHWALRNNTGVGNRFGWRVSTESFHNGVDISTALLGQSPPRGYGEWVYAAAAGTVVGRSNDPGPGSSRGLLAIDHGNGIRTQYIHIGDMQVRQGDSVTAGQRIARAARHSNLNNPYLHFEVRVDNNPANPFNPTQWRSGNTVTNGNPARFRVNWPNTPPGATAASATLDAPIIATPLAFSEAIEPIHVHPTPLGQYLHLQTSSIPHATSISRYLSDRFYALRELIRLRRLDYRLRPPPFLCG